MYPMDQWLDKLNMSLTANSKLTDQLNGAEFSHFSLILKMTYARVVETVVSNNSCFQSYTLPEYHSTWTS